MTLPPTPSEEVLRYLREVFAKVGAFGVRVARARPQDLACRAGCSDCCRGGLSLRAVEAAYVWVGVRTLPPDAAGAVRRALAQGDAGPCVLLHSGRCVAYAHRPGVCRSHGLPMLRSEGGTTVVHHCPRNFGGVDVRTLPASLLLDEVHLSLLLDAVDAFYSRESGWNGGRIAMSELLRAGLQDSSC